jgi:hypothetical protein
MRVLLFALVILMVGCTSAPIQKDIASPALLQDFQFVQNGQVIQPNNGVVKLARAPFYIKYLGKKTPSIFASSNSKVKEQFQLLRDPLVTPSGTASAAYPLQLYVNSEPLDIYEGWSTEFDKAWGSVFPGYQSDYEAFYKSFPSKPIVVMSGHNYTNFLNNPKDGYSLYPVVKLNEESLPNTSITFLYILLLANDFPSAEVRHPYQLQWAPLIIELL